MPQTNTTLRAWQQNDWVLDPGTNHPFPAVAVAELPLADGDFVRLSIAATLYNAHATDPSETRFRFLLGGTYVVQTPPISLASGEEANIHFSCIMPYVGAAYENGNSLTIITATAGDSVVGDLQENWDGSGAEDILFEIETDIADQHAEVQWAALERIRPALA